MIINWNEIIKNLRKEMEKEHIFCVIQPFIEDMGVYFRDCKQPKIWKFAIFDSNKFKIVEKNEKIDKKTKQI